MIKLKLTLYFMNKINKNCQADVDDMLHAASYLYSGVKLNSFMDYHVEYNYNYNDNISHHSFA